MPQGITPHHDPKHNTLSNTGLSFASLDVIVKTSRGYAIANLTADAVLDLAAQSGNEAVKQVEAKLRTLTTPRPDFAGLAMDMDKAKPRLMGVVNATPDSFFDGGKHETCEAAIAHSKRLIAEGADIIDIGGESTRPGAVSLTRANNDKHDKHQQEKARIVPIISALAKENKSAGTAKKAKWVISADTRHPPVMAAALAAGAEIINDVGGMGDKQAHALLRDNQEAGVIIMHMQGTPDTMQHQPSYAFAPTDIYDWLESRITQVIAAGVKRDNIAADIGFGFGKTPQHNMQLMAYLPMFHGLGVPLVLGASRKSTIAKLSRDESPDQRLPGSLALAVAGYQAGVQIIRVHDVAETAQAVALTQAIRLATRNML